MVSSCLKSIGDHIQEAVFCSFFSDAVPGIESPEGDLATTLTLYPLKDLPRLVNAFVNKGSDQHAGLTAAVQRVIASFDPKDRYWDQDAWEKETETIEIVVETRLGQGMSQNLESNNRAEAGVRSAADDV